VISIFLFFTLSDTKGEELSTAEPQGRMDEAVNLSRRELFQVMAVAAAAGGTVGTLAALGIERLVVSHDEARPESEPEAADFIDSGAYREEVSGMLVQQKIYYEIMNIIQSEAFGIFTKKTDVELELEREQKIEDQLKLAKERGLTQEEQVVIKKFFEAEEILKVRLAGWGFTARRFGRKSSAVIMPKHIGASSCAERRPTYIYPLKNDPKNPLARNGLYARVSAPDIDANPGKVDLDRYVVADNEKDITGIGLSAVHGYKTIFQDVDPLPLYTGEIPKGTPMMMAGWQHGLLGSSQQPMQLTVAHVTRHQLANGSIVMTSNAPSTTSGAPFIGINPEWIAHQSGLEQAEPPKYVIFGFVSDGLGERDDAGVDRSRAGPGAIMVPSKIIIKELLSKEKEAEFVARADPTSWHEPIPCSDVE